MPSHALSLEIKEIQTPGGIKAWFVEEKTIPILNMEVIWKGGGSAVAKEKSGLARLMAATLDEGAGDLDSKAFQKKLSDLSVSLSFDAGKDTFRGSLKTLSKNAEQAFELFGLAVNAPRFDEEAVERIKGQLLVGLNRQLSDPNDLAGDAWFELAFSGHPYAIPTEGTLETVPNLTPADLKSFQKNQLARDNMVIAVIGDISEADLVQYLDAAFASLPAKASLPKVERVKKLGGPANKIIPMDIPQSVIVFGGDGVLRDDPDYYAAYVLNYILGGGGFESRLYREIREKRGLVYSVYSYLSPFEEAGVHLGGLGTGEKTTIEAIELIRSELTKIRQNGVTERELEAAKKYLNGSFALRLSSNARIAGIMASMQFSNLSMDYLDERSALINAVSLEDIKRVAKRLMDPDRLLLTIVGKGENQAEWEEALKNF
ncbi:M16 family metallopeptidase [Sneathiella glossodoripedis]|uniref:M16 family metallopeptidase n=1 Tax=Sneathiella glossodoripedis TaxID=418853 RepID=UPI00190100E0|nr:pitrilysin family protein [Sneathiella glossodoripedis]